MRYVILVLSIIVVCEQWELSKHSETLMGFLFR